MIVCPYEEYCLYRRQHVKNYKLVALYGHVQDSNTAVILVQKEENRKENAIINCFFDSNILYSNTVGPKIIFTV